MGEPQPEPKKSWWDVVGVRIGVISGALGLLVALVGLPGTIADALSRSDSEVTDLEVQAKRAALADAGPRLDVRYQILTQNLFSRANSETDPADPQLASLPTVQNEITDQIYEADRTCRLEKAPRLSIAFLVITNRGRRDATEIAVELDRFRLRGPVLIRETAGDDYAAKLRAATAETRVVQVGLPRTLGPGEGARVPLFVAEAPWQRFDRWCAVPPIAYLPRSLKYVDPALRTTTRSAVRKMVDPVLLESGAIDRG